MVCEQTTSVLSIIVGKTFTHPKTAKVFVKVHVYEICLPVFLRKTTPKLLWIEEREKIVKLFVGKFECRLVIALQRTDRIG